MGEGETSCGVGSRNRTDCIGRIDNIGDGNFAGALWAVLLYCHIAICGNMVLYGNKAVALKRGPREALVTVGRSSP